MIIGAVTFDSGNPEELSDFYQQLLGWKKFRNTADGDTYIGVFDESKPGTILVFQETADYEKPVWPPRRGQQQTMVHLDFFVTREEYDGAVAHAVSCGARLADEQFSDKWTVLLDPAGHPFCIEPLLPSLA